MSDAQNLDAKELNRMNGTMTTTEIGGSMEVKRYMELALKSGWRTPVSFNIEEIEKVMLEKGITNHEAAAEYWQWMNQSAAPTPTGYNPSAIAKFDLNRFMKNPVASARDEASKALQELRRNPRPIGL